MADYNCILGLYNLSTDNYSKPPDKRLTNGERLLLVWLIHEPKEGSTTQ